MGNLCRFIEKAVRLKVEGFGEVVTDSLILSTGASAKFLGIPGEKKNVSRGVSTCATCDGFFFRGKRLVIVINRRHELRASKIMQQRAKENEKNSWALNKTPLEVLNNGMNVTGLKVQNNETGEDEIIETDGIFLAIGHTPSTAFLEDQIDTDEQGYIQVTPGSMATNVEGIFACGDV